MANINDVYPSKWLVAADIPGPTIVTIRKAEIQRFKGQDGKADEDKVIVQFDRYEKAMVCNKTNATTIASFYGEDTDDWIGERITIFPTKVQWGARLVDAIRVDTKLPKKDKAKAVVTQAEADAVLAKSSQADDDDLDTPF